MSEQMSNSSQHAFHHPELDLNPEAGPSTDLGLSVEEAFEVENTVRIILEGGYKTIGLQFPDELLSSSVTVFKAIQRRIGGSNPDSEAGKGKRAQAYVLGDSTYGSCCPDVLSCLHLPADLLVHYGHACLTPTDALPVHYVFPRKNLDVRKALDGLMGEFQEEIDRDSGGRERKGVVVVWDVSVDWLSDEIQRTFTESYPYPLSFATIRRPSLKPGSSSGSKGKSPALRCIEPPPDVRMADCVIWYIGEEGRSLVNLQMTHANNSIYHYSPSTNRATRLTSTSRLLSRRLYAVHQAIANDIFGLIVGSIGLASCKPLLDQLRTDLRKAKKKSYTLSIGRLNPAKLANFEGIECFVLVGCAEGGVVDSKDFYRPIITPWELQLALRGSEAGWDPSKWTLDLGKVLEDAQQEHREPIGIDDKGSESETDADAPEFSLVTGTYRTRKTFNTTNGTTTDSAADGSNALTVRNKEFSLAKLESAGSNYLLSREFKGLEVREGLDEPALLEEGRKGIARGYGEEV